MTRKVRDRSGRHYKDAHPTASKLKAYPPGFRALCTPPPSLGHSAYDQKEPQRSECDKIVSLAVAQPAGTHSEDDSNLERPPFASPRCVKWCETFFFERNASDGVLREVFPISPTTGDRRRALPHTPWFMFFCSAAPQTRYAHLGEAAVGVMR